MWTVHTVGQRMLRSLLAMKYVLSPLLYRELALYGAALLTLHTGWSFGGQLPNAGCCSPAVS